MCQCSLLQTYGKFNHCLTISTGKVLSSKENIVITVAVHLLLLMCKILSVKTSS